LEGIGAMFKRFIRAQRSWSVKTITQYNKKIAADIRARVRPATTTIVATLRDGTQRTTTFTRLATDAEVLEEVLEIALEAPTCAHIVAVHIFAGACVQFWDWERVRTQVYSVPAFLTRWECKPVYVSSNLTGYRAERRGPFGYYEWKPAYVGDTYKVGSFEIARIRAEEHARTLNKREGY
jgi:hypothetical protein